VLGLLLAPRSGYPFALEVEVEYSVGPASVEVEVRGRNVGRTALPYASGFHPYITVGSPSVDGCVLELPARTWYPTDERQIPTGREPVVDTPYDFTSPRTIGAMRIDTAFTDLVRADDGLARVRLASGDGERSVVVRLGAAYRYLMVFTGDTLEDEKRRRRSVGIEPMTAAPNAFQTRDGLLVLEPGETHVARWGLDVRG
jgi:aldose 1-epimerase